MSEVNQHGGGEEERLELPPGFRFHPTDEEVVSHYLVPKVLNCLFTCLVIADVDLNKCEPWDLPSMAKMGEKEWYFFCHKDRKYPTGTRTNRATESGYWKATGKDKEILRRGVLVGMKKTLVFYLGRAPNGKKTPWVMHEYRLEGKLPPNLPRAAKDEWAVCRVFNKDLMAKQPGQPTPSPSPAGGGMVRSNSIALLEELLDITDLPGLEDSPAAADDFKGAAAAGTSGNNGYYQQVKTEQQPNPAPAPPVMVTQEPPYFSFPAGNNGGVYAHPHAAERRFKAEASETGGGARSSSSLYPELDNLCPDPNDFITDYSHMWKF